MPARMRRALEKKEAAARAERVAAEQAAEAGREQTKREPPPATAAQIPEEHAHDHGHAALLPSSPDGAEAGAEDCCTAGTCRDDCPRGEDECCAGHRHVRRQLLPPCASPHVPAAQEMHQLRCKGLCPHAGGGAPRPPPSPPPLPGGGDDCCAAGTRAATPAAAARSSSTRQRCAGVEAGG